MYKVIKFIKKRTIDAKDRKLVNKLKFYPFILIICWSFATVDRIANFLGFELFWLHGRNINNIIFF